MGAPFTTFHKNFSAVPVTSKIAEESSSHDELVDRNPSFNFQYYTKEINRVTDSVDNTPNSAGQLKLAINEYLASTVKSKYACLSSNIVKNLDLKGQSQVPNHFHNFY